MVFEPKGLHAAAATAASESTKFDRANDARLAQGGETCMTTVRTERFDAFSLRSFDRWPCNGGVRTRAAVLVTEPDQRSRKTLRHPRRRLDRRRPRRCCDRPAYESCIRLPPRWDAPANTTQSHQDSLRVDPHQMPDRTGAAAQTAARTRRAAATPVWGLPDGAPRASNHNDHEPGAGRRPSWRF
jgi:hypothetical protein